MRQALAQTRIAADLEEVPVGAILIKYRKNQHPIFTIPESTERD
jgi:hypothetical protein